MTFQDKLDQSITKNQSLVCVGLDSDLEKIPAYLKTPPSPSLPAGKAGLRWTSKHYPVFEFNKAIINATYDLVCAYKLNSAFYEALGIDGIYQLKMTFDYLSKKFPKIPMILDAKRADIGNTNEGYVKFAFDYLKADAITLHPYLGKEALTPFLKLKDKGIIILCKTSNPGAGEFQDLRVILTPMKSGEGSLKNVRNYSNKLRDSSPSAQNDKNIKLYQYIAYQIAHNWNKNGNCMLVVGATYPEELKEIRKIVGDMNLLIPGVGAQGADIEKTIKAGLNSKKRGMIVNSSRAIIFASPGRDFADKAREETKKLRKEINKYRS